MVCLGKVAHSSLCAAREAVSHWHITPKRMMKLETLKFSIIALFKMLCRRLVEYITLMISCSALCVYYPLFCIIKEEIFVKQLVIM